MKFTYDRLASHKHRPASWNEFRWTFLLDQISWGDTSTTINRYPSHRSATGCDERQNRWSCGLYTWKWGGKMYSIPLDDRHAIFHLNWQCLVCGVGSRPFQTPCWLNGIFLGCLSSQVYAQGYFWSVAQLAKTTYLFIWKEKREARENEGIKD
jgi:hypothetical protein